MWHVSTNIHAQHSHRHISHWRVLAEGYSHLPTTPWSNSILRKFLCFVGVQKPYGDHVWVDLYRWRSSSLACASPTNNGGRLRDGEASLLLSRPVTQQSVVRTAFHTASACALRRQVRDRGTASSEQNVRACRTTPWRGACRRQKRSNSADVSSVGCCGSALRRTKALPPSPRPL